MNAQEFIFKTALLAEAAYASSDKLPDGSLLYPEHIRKLIEYIRSNGVSAITEAVTASGGDKAPPTQAAIDKGHKALEAKYSEMQSKRTLEKALKKADDAKAALQ